MRLVFTDRFERSFPVEDGKHPMTAAAMYDGQEIKVFEDEQQIIGMRPASAE